MPLAIGLSMLITATIGNTAHASTTAPIVASNLPAAQTLQKYVANYFADIPVMVDIAECESHFHQYNSAGGLYHGTIDNDDIGVMQINTHYNGAEAKALGIDITTMQGNLEFARYLYEERGTTPWDSSKACWGASADNQTLAVNSK